MNEGKFTTEIKRIPMSEKDLEKMSDLASLCKRRGFVF